MNGDDSKLTMPAKSNTFTLSYYVPDYLNQGSYTYRYKLDGLHDQWINNGSSSDFSFTNIPPGKYKFSISYNLIDTRSESNCYTLELEILPPWYQSTWAHLGYLVVAAAMMILAYNLTVRWYNMKKRRIIEKTNSRKKEEIYESKLRFFTNITHELSSPLTLIQGPCDKIIMHPGSDSYVQKYANLISRNTKRLNKLIQEIIGFQRYEADNYTLSVKSLDISSLINEVVDRFGHSSENKSIHTEIHTEPELTWDSDEEGVTVIVSNLISNAISYTPEGGRIVIESRISANKLIISVSNTGKGIEAEKLKHLFDRYRILDDFENKTAEGYGSNNGLGLATCHNMVTLLSGSIHVSSVIDRETVFTVELPPLTVEQADESDTLNDKRADCRALALQTQELTIRNKPFIIGAQTLLLLEKDQDMLWFIGDVLSDKYNIVYHTNPLDAINYLNRKTPDLIVTETAFPELSGIEFIRHVKRNKLLSHIPVIVFSSQNDTQMQIKAIDAGAEFFLGKPFDVHYLEQIVIKLIRRNEDLREYYSSVFSSHIIENGQVIHKEDKEFFESFLHVINSNLSDTRLSVEFISESLGCSSRQLFRKLKRVSDKTPNNFIRESRLSFAEKLLTTTNISIEEIIYKSGFNNKSNFYKYFSSFYGTTPNIFRSNKKEDLNQI